MFEEMKNAAAQKLEASQPQALSDAVRQEIGSLPPGEVAQQSQTAINNLQQSGDENLANELADAVRTAQQNPDALKRAVIGFVEAHPQTVTQFAPSLAEGILGRL
ncbi:MAG TPA: hypothetical protein VGN11_04560 [Candidatus Baltobacteraceae bacterium]|nr:hypothetical protein [Candidatus Baltobacteraceae bacterium]